MSAAERISDLESEVAFFKSELGLAEDAERVDRLRRAFGLTPSEAAILAAMHAAKGRALHISQLLEATPGKGRSGDATDEMKLAQAFVCRIRQKVGADHVLTVFSDRYRLSDEGVGLCNGALAIMRARDSELAECLRGGA